MLFLLLGPPTGPALRDWRELDDKVRFVLPRVGQGFGVQEIWAHERFFLRTMFTEMPSKHVSLTVFFEAVTSPLDDEAHPVWPLVARLVAKNAWRVYRSDPRTTHRNEPIEVPAEAFDAPLPDDHGERVASAVAGTGIDLSDLDAVAWKALRHAYGEASDVPVLVRAVASSDEATRRQGFRALYGNLYHQGSTYEATVAAVPFFLRIVRHGEGDTVLDMLRYLVATGERAEDVVGAIRVEESSLMHLAARPGELGLVARRLVACLARVSPTATEWLEGYVRTARSGTERNDLLYFIGMLPSSPRLDGLLNEMFESAAVEDKLAPALSLAARPSPPHAVLDLLLDVVEKRGTFETWFRDEGAWHVYDHVPDEIAFDALCSLSESTLASVVTRVGGPGVAIDRWPSLPEIAIYVLPTGASSTAGDWRVLAEVVSSAKTWGSSWGAMLVKRGLPGTQQGLRALLG